MSLEQANEKLIQKFGKNIPKIESYEEDDGTTWFRYWFFDGFEDTWSGFETVEEAFESICDAME